MPCTCRLALGHGQASIFPHAYMRAITHVRSLLLVLSNQMETVLIGSRSADGLTVNISQPLRYSHAGQTVSVPQWGAKGGNGTSDVMLAAVVGLLSRNVKIVGVVSSAAPTYGGHVDVGAVVRAGATFYGVLDLNYVQLSRFVRCDAVKAKGCLQCIHDA
jgi:hypothetical protein